MISDCYPPRVGGIESQVRDLSRRLVDAGHEVEVFTATNGAEGQRGGVIELVDGIRVHRLGRRVPFGLPISPGAKGALRERLRDGGFDVAHVHIGVISPFALDGGDAAIEVGLSLAVTWHCVLGRWEPVVARMGHARRWAAADAALHGVSEMAADQVRRLAPEARVEVLHNGIDAEKWRPDGPGRGSHTSSAAEPLRVVMAMRFTPRKRPLAVIDLVRRARERSSVPITLDVIGGGPLLPLVRRVVERRGWSDWVSLPGRIDRHELVEHYRAADVYLASSRFESFGIAALEGRTVGLPVVALAGSGTEEFVIDGVTGLVREGDEGLIAGLVELAEDRDLLRRLREHNETVVPSQDWSKIVWDVVAEYLRAQGTDVERETMNYWTVDIEGIDDADQVVSRFRLGHGADPVTELLERGWRVTKGLDVHQADTALTIRLQVEPTEPAPRSEYARVPVQEGLTEEDIATAHVYQRVAAYAFVESERGLLLTELSARTWRPGEWTLPGGGIDPGESALGALHREVWEETGQVLTDTELLGVLSSHWIGRSPIGRVEDFHAVRLYYRAHCPSPSDPVVHDVDGSTASAAWIPRARLETTPLASSLAPALAQWFD